MAVRDDIPLDDLVPAVRRLAQNWREQTAVLELLRHAQLALQTAVAARGETRRLHLTRAVGHLRAAQDMRS